MTSFSGSLNRWAVPAPSWRPRRTGSFPSTSLTGQSAVAADRAARLRRHAAGRFVGPDLDRHALHGALCRGWHLPACQARRAPNSATFPPPAPPSSAAPAARSSRWPRERPTASTGNNRFLRVEGVPEGMPSAISNADSQGGVWAAMEPGGRGPFPAAGEDSPDGRGRRMDATIGSRASRRSARSLPFASSPAAPATPSGSPAANR